VRIGFMGRTNVLFDIITKIKSKKNHKIEFIWTSIDESHYNFSWRKFKSLANLMGCDFIYSPQVKENMKLPDVDLIISINFPNMIPSWFFKRFKFGILNVHAGDLPKYRGNACPNWAILNNEKFIGLTIHKIDEGLDSGPIFCKKYFRLKNCTYINEVYEWIKESTPELLFDAIKKIESGIKPKVQSGKVLRTFPRKPEDSRLFFKFGYDWNYRLIRASSKPLNGAFCYLNNNLKKKLIIWEAEPIKKRDFKYDFFAINGQIIDTDKLSKSFTISIDNKPLQIKDFNFDGKNMEESFKIISKSMKNRLS
tara:strand:+ start:61 stop:987 length:927 start_codon:yes stop_codon:yes gene_type:complete